MENTQILTKIGNKIYQICKVVMLPTEKSSIHLVLDKELILCDKPVNKSAQHQPQHIYVLSDDKIKDTEYGFCMNLFRKGYTPRQIMFVMNTEQREAMIDLGGQIKAEVKKIIATTNEYLSINNFDDVNRIEDIEIHLPQPSQSFIKYFIEEYNKGNLIQEVLVEYDIKDTGTEQDNDGIKSHTSTN